MRDRRDFLLTVRSILMDTCSDFKDGKPMLQFARETIVALMEGEYESKKQQERKGQQPSTISSSESDAENASPAEIERQRDERRKAYGHVIDKYVRDSAESSINRRITDFRADHSNCKTMMEQAAKTLVDVENYYKQKYDGLDLGAKQTAKLKYMAVMLFARVGQMVLRNGNSSSILERAFAAAMRCVADRRVTLRKIFKTVLLYWLIFFAVLKIFF